MLSSHPISNYIQLNSVKKKVIEGTEYSVSLQMSDVITEEKNVMVNSGELIGATEYLTLST